MSEETEALEMLYDKVANLNEEIVELKRRDSKIEEHLLDLKNMGKKSIEIENKKLTIINQIFELIKDK